MVGALSGVSDVCMPSLRKVQAAAMREITSGTLAMPPEDHGGLERLAVLHLQVSRAAWKEESPQAPESRSDHVSQAGVESPDMSSVSRWP